MSPSRYASFAEFEREEIHPMKKAGFCLDDLEAEATYRPARDHQSEQEPEELDFG
ncbi:MAG: hypothetical protein OXU20_07180 [Myxococcales bacterium]|nr:hypothetical protein [Myxococcales bacterium]MDD9970629.1 hypothetical protein [Myxococcales bacterium]